jgi:dTDP-4-amino-4,6-dideoxygalactose transaminase
MSKESPAEDSGNKKRIDVTKTFLPPLEEYVDYLKKIWDKSWLTNQGPLLVEFEEKIKKYLGLGNFHFVNNGTLALQLSLRALGLEGGEIITTPFTYVATTSAILWEHCKPVYVDIDPKTFCMDPDKIEAAITKKTKAIMAVHVFGFPCDVDKIEAIAKKHNLKVIYDGAHAFGVSYKGKPLLAYGDISVCSFHATKLFHSIEGGAVISNDTSTHDRVELMKHFGHVGDDHYALGINAKANEFQAAMGLCNLKYIDAILAERKKVSEWYDKHIDDRFYKPTVSPETTRNYAYYPVVFESESQLHKVFDELKKENIHPRRYFYPSLNTLPYVRGEPCPISEDIASRIACLPLFVGLGKPVLQHIAKIMEQV